MEWPELAKLAPNIFPKDVVERASELSSEIGSIGAYSHSQGVPFIRKNVAKFIEGASVWPSKKRKFIDTIKRTRWICIQPQSHLPDGRSVRGSIAADQPADQQP